MTEHQNGMFFRCVTTQKFKTTKISVTLLAPLSRETAALYAILPGLLSRSCEKYPDFTALKRKLAMLYGAAVNGTASAQGDSHAITISISALDDRYAIENSQFTIHNSQLGLNEPLTHPFSDNSSDNISNECTDLLCEMLFSPNLINGLFSQEDVDAEKRQLKERIEAQQNDRRSFALQRCVEEMCDKEPHGVNPLGTIESVDALTPESITNGWRNLMSTARAEIIMIGNMDADGVEKRIREAFGSRPGYMNPPKNTIIPARSEVKEHIEIVDASQSKMVLGYRTNISDSSGDPFAARMMCACLGGTPHSRLFLNVREKLSLCYYCNSVYNKQKGLLFIQSGLEKGNVDKARKEISAQIKSIAEGNLTKEETENAKLAVKNSFLSSNDSVSQLDSWYRAQILSNEVLSPEEASERIMSITSGEIAKAARTLILDTAYLLSGE